MMSVEEHVLDLLSLYALDCLDDTETIRVSEHLARCPDCQAEWRAYRATVDQLALAGPGAAPSPKLKTRLMEHVQPIDPSPISQTPPNRWDSLKILMGRFGPALAAVGLVLLLLLGISNIWLWRQLNQLESSQPDLAVSRTVPLAGTEMIPLASGRFVVTEDGEHGTLVVGGLPHLDYDHQYQLWLIDDYGQRQNGGVFSVDQEGYGALWVSAPAPLSHYTALGITIEPAGGSPGPTGEKVMGGTLQ